MIFDPYVSGVTNCELKIGHTTTLNSGTHPNIQRSQDHLVLEALAAIVESGGAAGGRGGVPPKQLRNR